jgi:hypothetical protein
MTKIAGSGSISQRHGSPDPDPPQNVWIRNTGFFLARRLVGKCYHSFYLNFEKLFLCGFHTRYKVFLALNSTLHSSVN